MILIFLVILAIIVIIMLEIFSKMDREKKIKTLCPSCEKEVEQDFSHCPYCAKELKILCHECHGVLKPFWSVCPYCGATKMENKISEEN